LRYLAFFSPPAGNANRWALVPRPQKGNMPKGIIHTENIPCCIYTGDPGCLGYPAWINHEPTECDFQPVEFQFCDCGGNDVYGEMWHADECPRAQHCVQPTPLSLSSAETLGDSSRRG